MKKTAVPILEAMIVSLMAVPASWAGQTRQRATQLSKQCQDALKKNPNKDATKLCAEGDQLHKQGKQDEAVAKFTEGLEIVQGRMPKKQ